MISKDLKIIRDKKVDNVLFFYHGKILAQGKHSDLVKSNQEYANLLKKM